MIEMRKTFNGCEYVSDENEFERAEEKFKNEITLKTMIEGDNGYISRMTLIVIFF